MKQNLLLLFTFLLSVFGYSQQGVLTGKVIEPQSLVEGINVENLHQLVRTQTDTQGNFTIKAQIGDALVFSSPSTKKKAILLKKEHFESLLLIRLESETIIIDDVEISSQSMHVSDVPTDKLTPAERQYKSSGQIAGLNQGLEINLDAVYNWITGKRKDLKNAVEIEKLQQKLYQLDSYIDQEFYTESLGIAPEYINDFKLFLVDDNQFSNVLDTANQNAVILEVVAMSEKYSAHEN